MSVSVKVNNVAIDDYVLPGFRVPVVKRLRNWSPVAEGFSIQWSTNGPAPVKQHLVEILVDGDEHYLGFIEDYKRNYDNSTWEVEVLNYLLKLDNYILEWNVLHQLLLETGSTGYSFTVNAGTDIVTRTGHGLTTGDFIYVKSTGTLPVPLTVDKYYWVNVLDPDTFEMFASPVLGIPIDITDAGTGVHTFIIPDGMKYYPVFAEQGTATIKHLVEMMFSIVGITLDTALLDNEDLHQEEISSITYRWNWSELLIDENMLYCSNQSVATFHTTLDDTTNEYDRSKITLWAYIQELFGRLGIAIKYVGPIGEKTYKLYTQERGATTAIDAANEPVYAIANNDRYNYEERYIVADNQGYQYSRQFPDEIYIRAYYTLPDETQLVDNNYVKLNKGHENLSPLNGLKIYLLDHTSTENFIEIFDDGLYELFTSATGSIVRNDIHAVIMNWQQYSITCPPQLTIPTVKEEYLVVEEEGTFSQIIQEVNTLVSG